MDFIEQLTVTKGPDSTVTITGEIPFAELEKERKKAIAHLGTNIELDGFRKGKVPEKVLVGKLGETAILTEMAERALARIYPEILKTHRIDAIGYPSVQITKLAANNPLGFAITVAVMPEITLPDYKKIAAKINMERPSAEVTDTEVEEQAQDIVRQKVAYERLQKKAAEQKKKDLGEATELPTPETVRKESEDEEALPELTDEFVQGLGQPGQFSSVADFKEKLREHLAIEKQREVSAQHRAKITDAIIEKTKLELPAVLIDTELNQMFAQMEEDLARANLTMDDYLTHIKKTRDDLAREWRPAAEKRAKLQLILNEIAKQEEITPDEAEVETTVDQLLEQYKDADRERVRVYVESVLRNEQVMQFLENL